MAVLDAVVIGGGHNGLAAAALLAKAGRSVVLYEQRDEVGGACITEEPWPGWRVSAGAYLCSLLLPELIDGLELTRRGFEVMPRSTAGFAPFPDGRSLFLYADAARTRDSLARFCARTPQDVDAVAQFEQDVETAASIVDSFSLREPPSERVVRTAFDAAGAGALFEPFTQGSVRALLEPRIADPGLRAVLATDGLIGTYGGPSDPGTAYVLLHHYMGRAAGPRGAWGYVRGGMGRITAALAEAAEEAGARIERAAPVESILTSGGRAHGVRLAGGATVEARAVLSAADPWTTFEELLPAGDRPERGCWSRLRSQGGPSCKINLAVSELPAFGCLPPRRPHDAPGPEHLGTVHICPDIDYLEAAWADVREGRPSREPMIEMYIQTATDPSLAPPGCHILSLFTQYFPYNLAPGLDLDVERERYADRVVEIIGRYAPNVPGSILHRQVLTPRDIEARFGMTGGHIFHGDLLPPQLWDGRPGGGCTGARTSVGGLYLCGSGAHPGGCVFGAPGWNGAQAALSDLAGGA